MYVHTYIVQVKSGLFNTTYDIPRAATIPADNTEHKVGKNSCKFIKECVADYRPHEHETSVFMHVCAGDMQ